MKIEKTNTEKAKHANPVARYFPPHLSKVPSPARNDMTEQRTSTPEPVNVNLFSFLNMRRYCIICNMSQQPIVDLTWYHISFDAIRT